MTIFATEKSSTTRMPGSRGAPCNYSAEGDFLEKGVLQEVEEVGVLARRMEGKNLPVRGNQRCKDRLMFTVL